MDVRRLIENLGKRLERETRRCAIDDWPKSSYGSTDPSSHVPEFGYRGEIDAIWMLSVKVPHHCSVWCQTEEILAHEVNPLIIL